MIARGRRIRQFTESERKILGEWATGVLTWDATAEALRCRKPDIPLYAERCGFSCADRWERVRKLRAAEHEAAKAIKKQKRAAARQQGFLRVRRFTDEQLLKHHEAGLNQREIGEIYGCTGAAVGAHAKRLGLVFQVTRDRASGCSKMKSSDGEIRAAHAEGLTKAEIAKRYGCSVSTIGTRCARLGLKFRDARENNGRSSPVYTRREAIHGNQDTMMLAPDVEPIGFSSHDRLPDVDTLGNDPYLAALRRVHVVPRDEIYPGVRAGRQQSVPGLRLHLVGSMAT